MRKFPVLFAALFILTLTALPPVLKAQETAQICPVSGDPVKGGKFSLEHEGKTYRFCCKGCVRKFQKDPEKYIQEG